MVALFQSSLGGGKIFSTVLNTQYRLLSDIGYAISVVVIVGIYRFIGLVWEGWGARFGIPLVGRNRSAKGRGREDGMGLSG